MDGARDLAGGYIRAALRFQGTRLAIQLAGAIAHLSSAAMAHREETQENPSDPVRELAG